VDFGPAEEMKLSGGRRHLEFWTNGVFGHVIHFRVAFCITLQNVSLIRLL